MTKTNKKDLKEAAEVILNKIEIDRKITKRAVMTLPLGYVKKSNHQDQEGNSVWFTTALLL
jgi:hypothetical protein